MIKYEWRSEFDEAERAELADVLGRAAAFDAEPEYNMIDVDDVMRSVDRHDPRFRHLLIWMLPRATAMSAHDEPECIAGLLRLELTDDTAAKAALVVDPNLRSIGITTLLLEQVGLETAAVDGWWGTGTRTVGAWARGSHPASGRLGNRFLIPRTRRMWKLIRPTASSHDAAAAPVLELVDGSALEHLEWAAALTSAEQCHALREAGAVVGAVSVDLTPAYSEEFGRCATISRVACSPVIEAGALRRLFDGAAAIAHENGLSGLIVHVDSGDGKVVNACRLVGFQHDRTDVYYELGGSK